jgi:hypothetical protein
MLRLPRLLYVSDVPVEASYHGSALLYRLLEDYPRDKLLVVEAGDLLSDPSRRLPACHYERPVTASTRLSGLALTRLGRPAMALQLAMAGSIPRVLRDLADGFAPEAVLTVVHGYSWRTAQALARERGTPLHLVIHDDPPYSIAVPDAARGWLDGLFRDAYSAARSRMCVSPEMQEEYVERYGIPGSILYPSQRETAASYAQPRPATRTGLIVGYAGNVGVGDYRRALATLAASLDGLGGTLNIYGPASSEDLGVPVRSNVAFKGSVPNTEIVDRLRREVDVLFLPMSFEAAQEIPTRLCFPSKLADYTAARLPLLIRAPEYASARRWARENPGCAEIVESPDDASLRSALERLGDPLHRESLAKAAYEAGSRMFAPQVVRREFHAALMGTVNGEVAP